jgi:hypothetical protein
MEKGNDQIGLGENPKIEAKFSFSDLSYWDNRLDSNMNNRQYLLKNAMLNPYLLQDK